MKLAEELKRLNAADRAGFMAAHAEEIIGDLLYSEVWRAALEETDRVKKALEAERDRLLAEVQRLEARLKEAEVQIEHWRIALVCCGTESGAYLPEKVTDGDLEDLPRRIKQEIGRHEHSRQALEAQVESLEAQLGCKQADEMALEAAWAIANKSVDQQEKIKAFEAALQRCVPFVEGPLGDSIPLGERESLLAEIQRVREGR